MRKLLAMSVLGLMALGLSAEAAAPEAKGKYWMDPHSLCLMVKGRNVEGGKCLVGNIMFTAMWSA